MPSIQMKKKSTFNPFLGNTKSSRRGQLGKSRPVDDDDDGAL